MFMKTVILEKPIKQFCAKNHKYIYSSELQEHNLESNYIRNKGGLRINMAWFVQTEVLLEINELFNNLALKTFIWNYCS